MRISFCFWNSPLVSFWSGLVGAVFSRDSRLKAAPTARFFAMIGGTYSISIQIISAHRQDHSVHKKQGNQ
jgi:hypothetical protein